MKFFAFFVVIVMLHFIIIIIKNGRKAICVLELSINQSLDSEKIHFLQQIENVLNNNYSVIILQDDISFNSKIFFFPKNYVYVHLSQFNELFKVYRLYKKEEISKEDFHSSLHFFINTKLFFVSHN